MLFERSFYVVFQIEGQVVQELGVVDRVCLCIIWGLLFIKSVVFLFFGILDVLVFFVFCLQVNVLVYMFFYFGWDYCFRVDDRVMEVWDVVQRGGLRSYCCYLCMFLDMDRWDFLSFIFVLCVVLILKFSQFLGDGGVVFFWVYLSIFQFRLFFGYIQVFEVKLVFRRVGVRF